MTKNLLLIFLMALSVALQAQDITKAMAAGRKGVSLELALTGCIGGASNNSGNADLKNLSYESLTFSENSIDSIVYRLGAGINAGFEINLLFGKKKNLGLGTGIHFITGFNSFNTDDFSSEYRTQDANGKSFKRVLSSKDWEEKVTYSNISVPLLFKYRTLFGKKQKMGLFAEIGPVIVLLSSAKTMQEAKVDFGAVYATEGGLHYETQSAPSDWVLTRQAVEQHFSEGGTYSDVAAYFAAQYSKGYLVGIDKNATGEATTVKYKTGFGGLIRAGMIYKVSPMFALHLGGQCTIVSSARKQNISYRAVETDDDFEVGIKLNTLLYSTGPLLTAQYGLHVGLLFTVVK